MVYTVNPDSVINPWAYLTAREQAIRNNVNDPNHPDYDERHEYFGRPAIARRPRDLPPNEWENNSIMPIMRQRFTDNKEQIILDMINEQGPDTYWSRKSASSKNAFIDKMKTEYPDNAAFTEMELY